MRSALAEILVTTYITLAGTALAEVVVPPLKGLATADAIAAVKAAGFEYYIFLEPSCSPVGFVSETRPPEGASVSAIPPRVSLVISQGGVDPISAVIVPDVLRKSFVTAQQLLAEAGLNSIDMKSYTEGKGRCPEPIGAPELIDSVVATDPKTAAAVCKGSDVFVFREIYQRWQETPKGQHCK